MDEEYQNTVNQTSGSNPWADFEPIDTPPVNNIHNQRTISRPEAPSPQRMQPQPGLSGFARPAEQPSRPNPFGQNLENQSVQASVANNNIQPQPQVNLNQNPQPTPIPQAAPQPAAYQQQPLEYQDLPPQAPQPAINIQSQFQQNVNLAQPVPAPQQPVMPVQAPAPVEQVQFQPASNQNQPVQQQVAPQPTAPVFVNPEQSVEQPARPAAFENIAWNSASSGLEDYSQHLAEPAAAMPAPAMEMGNAQTNQNLNAIPGSNINVPINPDSSLSQEAPKSAAEHKSLFKKFGPKADTTIDLASAKPKNNIFSSFKFPKISFKKFKLKYLLFALLALALIGGASFAIIKFRTNSVKSTKLKPENQIVAEDIIELAKNDKADEIIKKYVRESNKASFPKEQFKESVQKLSQASSGKPSYLSENTAKIIVQPDTNPSDMNAYVYTTNYAGYKGKIYIRVDVFKNSADGKWYLYALAYNSKELKPDLTSSTQPAVESSPAPATQ